MNPCLIRRRWWVGFAIVLFTLLLPCVSLVAEAGESKSFYVTGAPVSSEDPDPVSRVNLYQTQKKSYLFLPGFWNRGALYPQFSPEAYPGLQAGSDREHSVALQSGEVTDAFAGSGLTLRQASGAILSNVEILQGSEIPCMFIQTDSGSLREIHKSKETQEGGRMVMFNPDGSVCYQGGLTQIRVRGNTTASYSKKPYQIKLSEKASLLGGEEAKTWVLLADYLDMTLLRNRITLDLAKAVGLRFAVDCQSVDLYVNGNYLGVYLLTDKVQINPGRVDIQNREAEMEFLNDQPLDRYPAVSKRFPDDSVYKAAMLQNSPADITGGYLLQIEKAFRIRKNGQSYVFTENGMGLVLEEPQIVSQSQIEYLHALLTAFDRAIRSPKGVDPQTGAHYDELFDMRSLAQKFLIEEFTQNYDAKAGSQYFYKDSSTVDPKVYAGPGWDYDLTYANCIHSDPSRGYLVNMTVSFPWYNTIYRRQEAFRQTVYQIYQSEFRPVLNALAGLEPSDGFPAIRPLTDYVQEIQASAEMNFVRWPSSSIKGFNRKMGTKFPVASQSLLTFIRRRIQALDQVLKP